MRRREFVLGAAALAGGGAALFFEQQRMRSSVNYPGRDLGHRLRDLQALPDVSETLETEILIAGSGVAGLTAAWQLKKNGVNDVLLIGGPEWHGNAAGGADGELVFPTGAHYLPLPSMESRHVREMLSEFEILNGDPYALHPTYDERFVVHAPAERVLYRGLWQEGYLPVDEVSDAERADHDKFFKIVDWYTNARGSDGRRAFAVPLELSSTDEDFRRLDRISFNAWLNSAELNAPTLRWYLNYCCRDDYGRHYDEISAWAGLHYFCSRDGQAANAERGAVLTWPQGLSVLTKHLEAAASIRKPLQSASVARLAIADGSIEALLLVAQGADIRVLRVKAKQAIAAMPLFVLKQVFPELSRYGFDPARDMPRYAPWMVSNFILRAFPEEQPGTALAWDNVVYKEPGLGYVVSTHQDIRMDRPARTAFTAYHALSDLEPDAARHWLDQASVADLTAAAGRDLRLAYGWRLPLCVEKIAITVRAHAMAVPEPGFLSNPGRIALRSGSGPLFFAHSDLSGLSVFEEAAWWGYRAAAKALAART